MAWELPFGLGVVDGLLPPAAGHRPGRRIVRLGRV